MACKGGKDEASIEEEETFISSAGPVSESDRAREEEPFDAVNRQIQELEEKVKAAEERVRKAEEERAAQAAKAKAEAEVSTETVSQTLP